MRGGMPPIQIQFRILVTEEQMQIYLTFFFTQNSVYICLRATVFVL